MEREGPFIDFSCMDFDSLIAMCQRQAAFHIGSAVEWLFIRIVSAVVIGMFVTVGMALASG